VRTQYKTVHFCAQITVRSTFTWHLKKRGKAVSLQAWSGPEDSRKLRYPDFMTTAQEGGKDVSLTPLPPLNTPGTHFCLFVCCECCVLSGRGLRDGLITRPEEPYRLWRIVVCDQETSKTRRLKPATGMWKYKHNGL